MNAIRVFVVAAALVIPPVLLAAPSAADPTVQVSPSTGLAGGDTVGVTASGITPSASVRVIQCDLFITDGDDNCAETTTTAADTGGMVSVAVTLEDPVFRSQEFGDPRPVYCRADVCRVFLVWTDESGTEQVLASDTLEFTGSPATITATPADGLRKRQWVRVTGTVDGAEGQQLRILEEACFSIVQGSGCYGELPAVTTTVAPDGGYAVRYRARRFLSDGTDCTGDILGACELNVVVLDASGTPDDSFGVSRVGEPAAWLTFRAT